MESYMEMLANHAKHAAVAAAKLGTAEKNKGLCAVADELIMQQELILAENQKDLKAAEEKGVKQSLIDRLALSEKRIADMAEGLRQIASLDDPVGEILSMKVRPNGLRIGQKRVPLGVVGIIYESRPNVTADAFGLCFKTGNAVILRGGSDAIYSNQAIVRVIKAGLRKEKLCQDLVLLVEDTSREVVNEMMKMHGLIDVLIPRGGAGLIANVVANSTVPVIETGTGNCHVYVDETADISMAADIIENAKTQRMGVCNACESLVIHSGMLEKALLPIVKKLSEHGIEIRGDERVREICPEIKAASQDDWGTEYLDAIISVKTVDSIDEAISHINKYNTGHSESIITNDYNHALKFQDEIDAAAVSGYIGGQALVPAADPGPERQLRQGVCRDQSTGRGPGAGAAPEDRGGAGRCARKSQRGGLPRGRPAASGPAGRLQRGLCRPLPAIVGRHGPWPGAAWHRAGR